MRGYIHSRVLISVLHLPLPTQSLITLPTDDVNTSIVLMIAVLSFGLCIPRGEFRHFYSLPMGWDLALMKDRRL